MVRPGTWEAEVTMNQELRDAFDDLKEDMKGAHAETRKQISEFGNKLHAHMIDDAVTAERVKELAAQKDRAHKWMVGLIIGGWGAIVTGLVELVLRHFTGK